VESMSIGEVARSTGVRPSALRYYEGVGLAATTGAGTWAQALRR